VRLELEPLLAEAEWRSVGRPDLARAMVAVGAASSVRDAFSRHLYDGGPVDVPHRALPIDEAIALGEAAGAAMALAHPHLYDERGVALLRRFRRRIGGVEAFHGAYDQRERARWIGLADQLGLVCTGGSDWHGPVDGPPRRPGAALRGPAEPGLVDGDPAGLGVDLPADRASALARWLGL
jgi:predicted metal-dependent phosphoesterase TrpH